MAHKIIVNLTWQYRQKITKKDDKAIYPTDETNCYRDRVQLVNRDAPANFTLFISPLTVEHTGLYKCQDKLNNFTLVSLTVEAKVSVLLLSFVTVITKCTKSN